MKALTRILIADDHPIVRRRLRVRVDREPGLAVAAEAGGSMETIACALALHPDIVLIDPIMHDGYGLQAIQRLNSELPGTVVVVLTAFVDTAMQMALREMGVVRILTKILDLTELMAVLKAAASHDSTAPDLAQPV